MARGEWWRWLEAAKYLAVLPEARWKPQVAAVLGNKIPGKLAELLAEEEQRQGDKEMSGAAGGASALTDPPSGHAPPAPDGEGVRSLFLPRAWVTLRSSKL